MAQPRVGRLFVRTLFALVVAAIGLWWIAHLRVDRCVARGERWNHDMGRCESARSGPMSIRIS